MNLMQLPDEENSKRQDPQKNWKEDRMKDRSQKDKLGIRTNK